VAFVDWLACASGGAQERAAQAVRATGDDLLTAVAFAGTAGHVLDYDDTFSDGVAHVSATCAPAALVLAAHQGLSLDVAIAAYSEGFEAMAAVAAASHPALYDAGWHPTAVCGPIGAAVTASRLLELSEAQRETAVALSVLRAGGARGAFGSDGKSIQVGLASAAGVQAALLARAGASVDDRVTHGPLGFAAVTSAVWPPGAADQAAPWAIERNWIKLHPSCLGTHSPIEVAARARDDGFRPGQERLEILVNPVARQAAHLDVVSDGLSAKFSIPYCVAYTFEHGPPGVRAFRSIDPDVGSRSELVTVVVDESIPDFGAVLCVDGEELARTPCPRGAPERPVSQDELDAKVRDLAGDRLTDVLADLQSPAVAVLEAAGLRATAAAVPA
jgi:2-methylcitrate dehydratase PrpD